MHEMRDHAQQNVIWCDVKTTSVLLPAVSSCSCQLKRQTNAQEHTAPYRLTMHCTALYELSFISSSCHRIHCILQRGGLMHPRRSARGSGTNAESSDADGPSVNGSIHERAQLALIHPLTQSWTCMTLARTVCDHHDGDSRVLSVTKRTKRSGTCMLSGNKTSMIKWTSPHQFFLCTATLVRTMHRP